jgi:hypothetical protein
MQYNIKSIVFSIVSPCNSVELHQKFDGTYRFHKDYRFHLNPRGSCSSSYRCEDLTKEYNIIKILLKNIVFWDYDVYFSRRYQRCTRIYCLNLQNKREMLITVSQIKRCHTRRQKNVHFHGHENLTHILYCLTPQNPILKYFHLLNIIWLCMK